MANKNNARLTDPNALIQLGIDPKTGLPIKWIGGGDVNIKHNIKRNLRIIDEQDAINRFTWYNLPPGLSGQLIERILYYRGQGAFFYMEANDKFYFLPYALDGTIDIYGRFLGITPLPFNGTSTDGKQKPWITDLVKEPQYEVESLDQYLNKDGSLNEEKARAAINNKCVLLHDYCKQQGEVNISRQILQEPILDVMSNCIPFMNTALLNSTGVQAMRVNDEDDQSNVLAASASVNQAALTGQKYIPVVGKIEFQDLSAGNVADAEEFLLAMQSLDNFRLSMYGLDNGGLFQKQSHILQAEQEVNNGNVGLIMQDSLTLRQEFCDIVNNIWGLGIYVDISETVIGVDRNGDMLIGDTQDQSGQMPGKQPEQMEGNE